MKVSYLLQTAAWALAPMQLVFSVFLFLRGHNEPGGGFAAGLVVAAALGLVAIAYGPGQARKLIRINPLQLAAIGLCTAIASGAIGPIVGDEFLTGEWFEIDVIGFSYAVGTPLLFDFGVYLLVMGIAMAILFGLMSAREDETWNL